MLNSRTSSIRKSKQLPKNRSCPIAQIV
jgi:hypothetical protein